MKTQLYLVGPGRVITFENNDFIERKNSSNKPLLDKIIEALEDVEFKFFDPKFTIYECKPFDAFIDYEGRISLVWIVSFEETTGTEDYVKKYIRIQSELWGDRFSLEEIEENTYFIPYSDDLEIKELYLG